MSPRRCENPAEVSYLHPLAIIVCILLAWVSASYAQVADSDQAKAVNACSKTATGAVATYVSAASKSFRTASTPCSSACS